MVSFGFVCVSVGFHGVSICIKKVSLGFLYLIVKTNTNKYQLVVLNLIPWYKQMVIREIERTLGCYMASVDNDVG